MFFQNVIAIVWDFDKTLSPHYMQKPLFEAYDIDEDQFWREVHALPAYYERAGIHVQPDTVYLTHLLSYVKDGRMPGLTNAKLRQLGAGVRLYAGLPRFFERLQAVVDSPEFREGDLKLELEHYVVSTGLAEMVRGSEIADRLSGVWACEFIEELAAPGTDFSGKPAESEIGQIAGFLDNTTKTRALFEINKGVNKSSKVTVNDTLPEDERRVPFKNMIYIADGPSDIPSFSVVQKHGGLAYAVYAPHDDKQFEQVNRLQQDGRVHMIGPADYTPNSQTDMWLRHQVKSIAQRIIDERRLDFEGKVGKGPTHLDSE
ncbi:MAG: haloacid dehalogenase-like hydrolase [bacterium]|nr:haloacid dehalogenase-like hydrolase [bacterium]